ncbi:1,4-dihydroxy-2-naphthoate polyprenyltransferase [Enemella sp. A6]|uniref:1,4-dihydroxy-2-naphthoate polyprenyltransferase n=1 Tax=Enemella sp. A6 TaxID=3440152 RepID=UPI003EB73E05
MSGLAAWVEGARLRTLPAAVAPVFAGAGVAWWAGGFNLGKALLCAVVALALQIGVNFANDYSDGIRGTDDERRIGPQRLVGSGAASPRAVKLAAFGCFALAGLAGLALTWWTGHWFLLAIGAAAVLAAWFYTGGPKPYGYLGLGEVFVFLFFGLVAVNGTTFVMLDRISWASWWASIAIGSFACAILVANNLRDIAGDRQVGKHTLATRLGDRGTRSFFIGLLVIATAGVVAVALASTIWALFGLIFLPLLVNPVRSLIGGARGLALIGVLKMTGIAELLCGVGLFFGFVVGAA